MRKPAIGKHLMSKVKASIRRFLPQPLYEFAHQIKVSIFGASTPAGKLVSKSFSSRTSFAQAQREAGIGYGDEAVLAKAHIGPAQLIQMQDYSAPMLAGIALAAASGNNQIRVLDFGGGSGFFRAYVNDFFDQRIQTEWRVVETPEHVQYSSGFTFPGFEYSSSIGGDRYDFAIFSGSLNYVPDWQAVLREINADLIFIARTPVDDVTQPYLQTVAIGDRTTRFAGRIIERSALFELLSETHDLFASWDFQANMLQMGKFSAPAMLWRRRSAAAER
jgi:putative methyltransferase (TIGR04325 family)